MLGLLRAVNDFLFEVVQFIFWLALLLALIVGAIIWIPVIWNDFKNPPTEE